MKFPSMGDLIPQLADAIAPHLNQFFAFFGHSMGAVVAYELAQYLGKTGRHEDSRRAGKLAYDPDLSGPSSPQRAPSPPLYSFSTAIGWLNGL